MSDMVPALIAGGMFVTGLFLARISSHYNNLTNAVKLSEAESEIHRLRDELAVWKSVAIQGRTRLEHQRNLMRRTYYLIVHPTRNQASHDTLVAKQREQWPALWEALDEIVTEYERPLTAEEATQ